MLRIRRTEGLRRYTAAIVSIMLTGVAIGLLVVAAYQRSSYVQGLLVNIGTSLVIIVPLALLTGLLITRLSDLQRRVSLREASDVARMNLKERSLRRAGPRVEGAVHYSRIRFLQLDPDEAAHLTAQAIWSTLALLAQDITAVAVESGLTEVPGDDSPRKAFVAEWAGLSWKEITNDSQRAIGYPLIDAFTSFVRTNWVVAIPYDGPPIAVGGRKPVAQDYPAWRMSMMTFSEGSMVTALVGHQVVDEHGNAERPWFCSVVEEVQDDQLDICVGQAAAEWYNRSASQLDLLGAMVPRA